MQITFIRHLPTEWNEKALLQGRKDTELIPLTASNQNQINFNKKYLNKLPPFDLILTSSLKRAQQTAKHYGFETKVEALLDELDFGSFEGLPKENLLKEYGNTWTENPVELILGESIIDLEERILSFLKKYQSYGNILVFGHGSWIRAFLSYCNYGHLNNMNKLTVENNECITLLFEPPKQKEKTGEMELE